MQYYGEGYLSPVTGNRRSKRGAGQCPPFRTTELATRYQAGARSVKYMGRIEASVGAQ
jgi:hypothetical protein